MNQPVNPLLNHNHGPTVATISEKPRMKDVDVVVISRGGAMIGEDGLHPQIQLDRKK